MFCVTTKQEVTFEDSEYVEYYTLYIIKGIPVISFLGRKWGELPLVLFLDHSDLPSNDQSVILVTTCM